MAQTNHALHNSKLFIRANLNVTDRHGFFFSILD
jgi:hypothetical protein